MTKSQNHRITDTKVTGHFVIRVVWNAKKKNFSSIGENNTNRSDNIILSFGRIKNTKKILLFVFSVGLNYGLKQTIPEKCLVLFEPSCSMLYKAITKESIFQGYLKKIRQQIFEIPVLSAGLPYNHRKLKKNSWQYAIDNPTKPSQVCTKIHHSYCLVWCWKTSLFWLVRQMWPFASLWEEDVYPHVLLAIGWWSLVLFQLFEPSI